MPQKNKLTGEFGIKMEKKKKKKRNKEAKKIKGILIESHKKELILGIVPASMRSLILQKKQKSTAILYSLSTKLKNVLNCGWKIALGLPVWLWF